MTNQWTFINSIQSQPRAKKKLTWGEKRKSLEVKGNVQRKLAVSSGRVKKTLENDCVCVCVVIISAVRPDG